METKVRATIQSSHDKITSLRFFHRNHPRHGVQAELRLVEKLRILEKQLGENVLERGRPPRPKSNLLVRKRRLSMPNVLSSKSSGVAIQMRPGSAASRLGQRAYFLQVDE